MKGQGVANLRLPLRKRKKKKIEASRQPRDDESTEEMDGEERDERTYGSRGALADTDGTQVAVCSGEPSLKKIARGSFPCGMEGESCFRLQMKGNTNQLE